MAVETRKRGVNFADILFYIAVVMKHLRLMVLLVCFALTLGLTYYVYARPLYFARSLVRVDTIERPMDTQTVFRDSTAGVVAQQLTAPHVLTRTARALGQSDVSERNVHEEAVRSVVARFNSERNLEVSVWTYKPQLARAWTEAMIREFQMSRAEQRARYHENILQSFSVEMEEISAKMQNLLNSKLDFAQENERTKITVEMNQFRRLPMDIAIVKRRLAAMDNIQTLLKNPKLSAVEKLSLVSYMEKDMSMDVGQAVTGAVEANDTSKPIAVVLPSTINPSERPWEESEKKLRQLDQRLAELSRTYLPGHIKMRELVEERKKVEASLALELEGAINRFNLEYTNLKHRLGDLEAQLPKYLDIMQKDEQYRQQFAQFEAGQLTWANMYKSMATKINTLDFAVDKERTYLQFLNHIEVYDDQPVSPNKLKLLIYSLALGLALAIGVPFLLEFLDHTVSNVEQVESAFHIRGLGIVPRIGTEDLKPLPLLSAEGPADRQLLENFRVIRTNLLLNAGAKPTNQVIVVASAMPQEGKTVVSTNLAVAFAQKGEKTLLIDADLRRGRLHRVFGVSSKPGLSEVFNENLDWRRVCLPTGRENLDLLPAGPHIIGATEMFGTEKFSQLMAELRQHYQRIIIDTPPILGLSETSMMQPFVDGVLFVIWSGRTPLRNVKAAVKLLQSNGATFYGFVLNRLDLSAATNYYHYYYYSYEYYDSYRQAEKA